LKKYTFKTNRQ